MQKNKELLKEYIKSKIRTILLEKKLREKENTKNLAKIGLISMRFPGVKKNLEALMSPSFAYYVKSIDIVSPKPTTFKVTLNNSLDFELIYDKKTYSAKISGKKYYLLNIGESERASQSISDLLSLSPAEPQNETQEKQSQDNALNQSLSNDLGTMGGGGGNIDTSAGLPELQPDQIPTEEVPGAGGISPTSIPTTPQGGFGGPNPTP